MQRYKRISLQNGVTESYNFPINCAGVLVYSGDVVVTDGDGVIVVPQEHALEGDRRLLLTRCSCQDTLGYVVFARCIDRSSSFRATTWITSCFRSIRPSTSQAEP
ncbi:MAG: hypothetical protein ACODAD_08025 [Planctomycetota bacterium]